MDDWGNWYALELPNYTVLLHKHKDGNVYDNLGKERRDVCWNCHEPVPKLLMLKYEFLKQFKDQ